MRCINLDREMTEIIDSLNELLNETNLVVEKKYSENPKKITATISHISYPVDPDDHSKRNRNEIPMGGIELCFNNEKIERFFWLKKDEKQGLYDILVKIARNYSNSTLLLK